MKVEKKGKGMMKKVIGKNLVKPKPPTKAILVLLEKLENNESKNSQDILKLKIEMGKKVAIAKSRLEKQKMAFRPYVKEHFNDRMNRIYEALAIRRANKHGLGPEMGATVLIKVGQGLRARKKETRKLFKNLVKNKKIEVGGEAIELIPSNRTQLLNRLRDISSSESTPEIQVLPKVDTAIVKFREYFLPLAKEEKAQLANKIDLWLKELTKLQEMNMK